MLSIAHCSVHVKSERVVTTNFSPIPVLYQQCFGRKRDKDIDTFGCCASLAHLRKTLLLFRGKSYKMDDVPIFELVFRCIHATSRRAQQKGKALDSRRLYSTIDELLEASVRISRWTRQHVPVEFPRLVKSAFSFRLVRRLRLMYSTQPLEGFNESLLCFCVNIRFFFVYLFFLLQKLDEWLMFFVHCDNAIWTTEIRCEPKTLRIKLEHFHFKLYGDV